MSRSATTYISPTELYGSCVPILSDYPRRIFYYRRSATNSGQVTLRALQYVNRSSFRNTADTAQQHGYENAPRTPKIQPSTFGESHSQIDSNCTVIARRTIASIQGCPFCAKRSPAYKPTYTDKTGGGSVATVKGDPFKGNLSGFQSEGKGECERRVGECTSKRG